MVHMYEENQKKNFKIIIAGAEMRDYEMFK